MTNRVACFCVWLVMLFAVAAHADEWLLLPEPKFMEHKVARPLAGAKATVLAVAKLGEHGPEFPLPEEWQAAGVSDGDVLASTRRLAVEWLKQVKPVLVRDKKKVVEYAVLRSEALPICAAVLAPEFWKQFEEIFGAKMLVVMPNRNTVFVFPVLDENRDQRSRLVLQAWRSGAPKVSLEAFELSEQGMRAVGAFEE